MHDILEFLMRVADQEDEEHFLFCQEMREEEKSSVTGERISGAILVHF